RTRALASVIVGRGPSVRRTLFAGVARAAKAHVRARFDGGSPIARGRLRHRRRAQPTASAEHVARADARRRAASEIFYVPIGRPLFDVAAHVENAEDARARRMRADAIGVTFAAASPGSFVE